MKYGGGSEMVRGLMSANVPGDLMFFGGIIDKIKYLNILKDK